MSVMQLNIKRWPHNWLFFVLCTAYLALVIEPNLLYACFGSVLPDVPAFPAHLAFAGKHLSQPSGLLLAVTGLLSQCFYTSWSGSLVIVATALGLSELARRHFKAAGFGSLPTLTCLPMIVMMLMYSRYQHPLLGVLVVCLGLLSAWAYVLASRRYPRLGAPLLCAATVLTFWLGGTGALIVFLAMALVHLLCRRTQGLALVLGLPMALAIIWLLLQYLALISVADAWPLCLPLSKPVTGSMKAYSKGIMIALYSFVPVCLSLLVLARGAWHRINRNQSKKARKGKKARAANQSPKLSLAWVKAGATLGCPFVILGLALFFSHDPLSKPYVQIHHHSHLQQWDKVLDTARHLPKGQTNVYVHHAIVRALFHTDRLPFDLLKYPQTPQGLFLTHESSVSNLTQLKLHDLFLELGQVNMAEKQASELLAADIDIGSIYERLIWVHIIKEQHDTARIFVNALHKDPLYRQTAQDLVHILDQGLPDDQVKRIERIRACMPPPTETVRESLDQMLIQLLNHNPGNQMAFEYLMTLYCLAGQVNRVAALLPQSARFNYPSTPALYQEAAVVYFSAQKQDIDTKRTPITPDTLKRYRRFTQLRTAFQQRKQKALLGQLIEEFGSSYFFYHAFGQVGLK
jgi:hypothetical protein